MCLCINVHPSKFPFNDCFLPINGFWFLPKLFDCPIPFHSILQREWKKEGHLKRRGTQRPMEKRPKMGRGEKKAKKEGRREPVNREGGKNEWMNLCFHFFFWLQFAQHIWGWLIASWLLQNYCSGSVKHFFIFQNQSSQSSFNAEYGDVPTKSGGWLPPQLLCAPNGSRHAFRRDGYRRIK